MGGQFITLLAGNLTQLTHTRRSDGAPDPDGPLQKVVNLVVTLEKASADVSLK
jgi:hypothetical protein